MYEKLQKLPMEKRDYLLRHLPQTLIDSGQAGRLFTLLSTFAFLEVKTVALSVFDLLEDLGAAIKVLEAPDHASEIGQLRNMLDQEAYILGDRQRDTSSQKFAQQVLYRAVDFGLGALADEARQRLIALEAHWLDPRWSQKHESRALIKTVGVHGDQAVDVAFLDEATVVSTALDGSTIVWDLATGERVETITGHDDAVSRLDANPDFLITGDLSGRLQIRSRRTEVKPVFHELRERVSDLAISASNRLIVVDQRSNALVFDLPDLCHRLRHHAVESAAISADGHTGATGGHEGSVRIWDLDQGEVRHEIKLNYEVVTRLRWHDGSFYALAGDQQVRYMDYGHVDYDTRQVVVIDPEAGQVIEEVPLPITANDFCLTPAGKHLIVGGRNTQISVVALSEPEFQAVLLAGHSDPVEAVALSADGNSIVSAGFDFTVRLWDMARAMELDPGKRPVGHTRRVNRVAVLADDQMLASTSNDGSLRFWDPQTGEPFPQLTRQFPFGWPQALAVDPSDDRYFMVGNSMDELSIWNISQDSPIAELPTGLDGIRSIVISRTGNFFAAGASDGRVKFYSRYYEELYQAQFEAGINDLALAEQPLRLYVALENGTVGILDSVNDSQQVFHAHDPVESVFAGNYGTLHFDVPKNGVTGLALVSDQRRLLTCGEDGALNLFDVETLGQLDSLPLDPLGLQAIVLTLGDDLAVLAAGSGRILIIALDTLTVLGEQRLDVPLNCLALTKDGRYLTAGASSGHLYGCRIQTP